MLKTEEGRKQVLSAWEQLTELHRHEDKLLNNRLQTFVVSTAVLVAAFSQFRDFRGWILAGAGHSVCPLEDIARH
jgi:hypothetical protein